MRGASGLAWKCKNPVSFVCLFCFQVTCHLFFKADLVSSTLYHSHQVLQLPNHIGACSFLHCLISSLLPRL